MSSRICGIMMRAFSLLLLLGLALGVGAQSKPFKTKWKTIYPNQTLKIPIHGTYRYKWYKASGNSASAPVRNASNITNENRLEITVPEVGEYVLEVGPVGVKRIQMKALIEPMGTHSATRRALEAVLEWGDVAWETFVEAFSACDYIMVESGAGKPKLPAEKVSFLRAFRDTRAFVGPIDWDMANADNCGEMFSGALAFNYDISGWNVSKVSNMSHMFSGAVSFNQNLGNWQVGNVSNMSSMFEGATAFNQNLGAWNVSKVTNMSRMFKAARSFEGDVSAWQVSSVTNMDEMFSGAKKFNASLSKWDVSNVESMKDMFSGAEKFDQSLASWHLKSCKELGLQYCNMSVANYSASLIAWSKQEDVRENLVLKATGREYNNEAAAARDFLIKEKGWVIEGDQPFDPVVNFSITNAAPLNLTVGEEGVQLTFTYQPPTFSEFGAIKCVASPADLVKVEGTKITGLKPGEGILAVTIGTIGPKKIPFRVFDPVSDLIIRNPVLPIPMGKPGKDKILVEVVPSTANQHVEYRVNPADENVIKVEPDGTVTAVNHGTAIVTVTGGGVSKQVMVIVGDNLTQPVQTLTVNNAHPIKMLVGQREQLTVTISPKEAAGNKVTYPVEPEGIVTISPRGEILAVRPGVTTVMVTAGTVTQPVRVEVYAFILSTPSIPIAMSVGQEKRLDVRVLPESADQTVQYAAFPSDGSIVTVDANGKILAKGNGKAQIVITAAVGVTKTVDVVVGSNLTQPLSTLSIANARPMVMIPGERRQLIVIITPDNAAGTPLDYAVAESMPADVLEIDKTTGIITAKRVGKARVKVLAGGKEDAIEVVVRYAPVESITIRNPSPIELEVGATVKLDVEVRPANAEQTVSYAVDSGGESIIRVDADGTLTGVAKGEATITVTAGGKSATIRVVVRESPVDEVVIKNPSPIELEVGATVKLDVEVRPSTADQTVSYAVEPGGESLIKVDADGMLTGVAKGKATITVTAGGKSATIRVVVRGVNTEMTSLFLDTHDVTLQVGETMQLNITIQPETATDKSVSWSSSASNVVKVEDGKLQALAVGMAIVRVEAANGLHAECDVTVVPADITSVESSRLAAIRVVPNPFADVLRFEGIACVVRYELLNANGMLVQSGAFRGEHSAELRVSHLPHGLYLVRLFDADGLARVVHVVK